MTVFSSIFLFPEMSQKVTPISCKLSYRILLSIPWDKAHTDLFHKNNLSFLKSRYFWIFNPDVIYNSAAHFVILNENRERIQERFAQSFPLGYSGN